MGTMFINIGGYVLLVHYHFRFQRMPDELIRLLKNVKSSSEAKRIIESQLVKRGQEDEVEKRTETISVAATIKCPVPRNKTVITTYGKRQVLTEESVAVLRNGMIS